MFLANTYKENNYPFPSEINPEQKKGKYCKQVLEAIYSKYIKNRCGIYYSDLEGFKTLREFGAGKQPMERYKNYLLGELTGNTNTQAFSSIDGGEGSFTNKPKEKRKGYYNVLWKVISIAPKIQSAIIGKFHNIEYSLTANPVDAKSGAEKENQKYRLWLIKENLNFLQQYHAKIGVPMETLEFLPETLTELNLYDEKGGFKPEHAKQIENLNTHTFAVSDWKEIKDMLVTDALNIRFMVVQDYFDEEDGFYKPRYINPDNFVIQHSEYYDFRDSEYAGHFYDKSIGELKPILKKYKYSEKKIAGIAKSYSGYMGNPSENDWEKYAVESESEGIYGYDFFKVCVFTAEWQEIDGEQFLKHTNKQGRNKIISQKYGTKNKNNENNETIVTTNREKYVCEWIINTDVVFNYGKAFDILRPTEKTIALSYHCYKLPTPRSITDQLIPLYDNMMILWVKYQQAIAMAKNFGYAINYDSISNITAGGGDATESDEAEVLKRFLQSGSMIFKETTAMGIRNTNMKPVYEIPGGIGQIFLEIQQAFEMNIRMVEQLTGISPLALGSVDPKAPVTTAMESVATTQDTIRSIIMGYMKIKEKVAENIVLWTQLKIRNKDEKFIETYKRIIGEKGIKILQIAEKNMASYGIDMVASPTEQEKRDLYEICKESLRIGKIKTSDFFLIEQIIFSNGSLKLAEQLLRSAERANEIEINKEKKDNLKIQQEGNIALKNAEAEKAAMEIRLQNEADLRLEVAKAKLKAIENEDKKQRDLDLKEIDFLYQNIISQNEPVQKPTTKQI